MVGSLAALLGASGAAGGGVLMFLYIALIVVMIAAEWKIFTKAGKPGWACLVPIYNMIVLLEVVGRPIWWILLFFIPVVSFIVAIMIMLDLAKVFGKSSGFAIGLIFLPFIFMLILGFGSAEYSAPATA